MYELEVCSNKTYFPLASTAITSAASMKRILLLVLIAIRADVPIASVRVWGDGLLRLRERPAGCRKPIVRGGRIHSFEGSTTSSTSLFPEIEIACSRVDLEGTTSRAGSGSSSHAGSTSSRECRSPLSKRPPSLSSELGLFISLRHLLGARCCRTAVSLQTGKNQKLIVMYSSTLFGQ